MNKELTEFLWNLLVTTSEINRHFVGVPEWVWLEMAPSEHDFPYIAHSIREGRYSFEHSQVVGEWNISVYTAEVRTVRIQEIVSSIKRSLHGRYFSNQFGIPVIQIYLDDGGAFIETGNERTKRYDFSFEIRYSKTF